MATADARESEQFLTQLLQLKQEHARHLMSIEKQYYEKLKSYAPSPFAGPVSGRGRDEGDIPAPRFEINYREEFEPVRSAYEPVRAIAPVMRPSSARASLGDMRRSVQSTGDAYISGERPRPASAQRHRMITPIPFQFEERAKARPKTIAQKRLEADLAMKVAIEEAELAKRFKANPLPKAVIEPRLQKLMEEQRRRQEEVKRRSVEITLANERPFTFYYRDKEKFEKRKHDTGPEPEKFEPFKANPIPVSISMAPENFAKQEEERRRRVMERSNRLLRSASLPPRMEIWNKQVEAEEASGEKKKPTEIEGCTFKPYVNHKIPDYKRQQQAFADALERNKRLRGGTTPQPFNFRTDEVDSHDKILADIENDERALPEKRWPYLGTRTKVHPTPPPEGVFSTPRSRPRTTKTNELRIHTVRKSLEYMRVKEGLDLEEEKVRKARSVDMARSIRPHLVSNKAEFEQRVRERREDFIRDEKDKERMAARKLRDMEARVKRRPFLFQLSQKQSAVKAAEKKFRQTLIESGLNPDDFEESDGHEGHRA